MMHRPFLLDPFADMGLDFWSPFSQLMDRHWSSTALQPHHRSTPEITEAPTAFYITVDTAGYTRDELDVHVHGNEVGRLCRVQSICDSDRPE